MKKKFESTAIFDSWSDRILTKKLRELLTDIRNQVDGELPSPMEPRAILEDTVAFSMLAHIRKAFLSIERRLYELEKEIIELRKRVPNATGQLQQ